MTPEVERDVKRRQKLDYESKDVTSNDVRSWTLNLKTPNVVVIKDNFNRGN